MLGCDFCILDFAPVMLGQDVLKARQIVDDSCRALARSARVHDDAGFVRIAGIAGSWQMRHCHKAVNRWQFCLSETECTVK
jgi:hypothetical protein